MEGMKEGSLPTCLLEYSPELTSQRGFPPSSFSNAPVLSAPCGAVTGTGLSGVG